jgi:hypothetical protein
LINGLHVGPGLADRFIIGPSRYCVNLLSDFDIRIVQQEIRSPLSGLFMELLATMPARWLAIKESGELQPGLHEVHHPLRLRTVA